MLESEPDMTRLDSEEVCRVNFFGSLEEEVVGIGEWWEEVVNDAVFEFFFEFNPEEGIEVEESPPRRRWMKISAKRMEHVLIINHEKTTAPTIIPGSAAAPVKVSRIAKMKSTFSEFITIMIRLTRTRYSTVSDLKPLVLLLRMKRRIKIQHRIKNDNVKTIAAK